MAHLVHYKYLQHWEININYIRSWRDARTCRDTLLGCVGNQAEEECIIEWWDLWAGSSKLLILLPAVMPIFFEQLVKQHL